MQGGLFLPRSNGWPHFQWPGGKGFLILGRLQEPLRSRGKIQGRGKTDTVFLVYHRNRAAGITF